MCCAHCPHAWNVRRRGNILQFDHRVLAVSTLLSTTGLFAYAHCALPMLPPVLKTGLGCMVAMAYVQVALGVTTLLHAVPVSLGAAHQAGALTLFTFTLWTIHAARLPRAGSATLREARNLLANGRVPPRKSASAMPGPAPVAIGQPLPQVATAPAQARQTGLH